MIVSHKNRFVFVKTRKTGGSSIEHALEPFCSINDILTPLPPEVKIPDQSRNCHRNGQLLLQPHDSGEKILELFPETKDYTWFTVERHPYTKTISAYYYIKNSIERDVDQLSELGQLGDLDNFIFNGYSGEGQPVDDHLWCAGGKPIVDGILRFEHLAEDFAQLGKLLDLPLELNTQLNKGKYDNIELNRKQKKQIMKLFRNSNKFTGYGD